MHRGWFAGFCVVIMAAATVLVACGGSKTASNTVTPAAPAPGGSSSGGSTSPNSTVIDNVQSSAWQTCGNCGNGGAGPIANYSYALNIPVPSEDNAATQFSIFSTTAFLNGYFFLHHTPISSQFNALSYEFDLYIPAGMENAPQALEFECQQVLGGYIYNFAWQADYGRSLWRVYDYVLGQWDPTSVPFQRFSPGTWHHIMAEFHNDASAHTVIHDALTIDGVRTPVGMAHNAFFSGGGAQFTNAVQLDLNGVPTPYSIYVDKMRITYQ